MTKYYFIILLSCLSLSYFGQTNNAEALGKLYPNKGIAYLFKDEIVTITNDKNGLAVSKHIKEQYIIINDAGKNYTTRSVYSSSFIEAKNIKGVMYIPNGSRYSKVNVEDIKVSDHNSDGTFYDGSKKITVTYPSGSIGCIVELEYDEIYKEPRFFGSNYLSEYFPVLKATCSVKYPNTVVVNDKGFNLSSLKVSKTEKVGKNDKTVTWVFDTIPPFKEEDYSPNYRKLASSLLFNIQEYKKDNATINLVGSVDNLYNWYLDLVKNLNKSPSPQLKQITDSLVTGCKTDLEKVKKIYYWVQDKISYIAYEDGLGGYIPRESDIICKRRFGDCKDMASILTSMGQAANLPIYLTWIGSREIPYQFSEVPAPMAANHMIAAYVTKDTILYLDATGKFQDLGTHTAFIQGKEAIIGITNENYKISVVPNIPAHKSYVLDSVSVKLDNTTLLGQGTLIADGYRKVNMQNRISGKSYKELYDYFNAYCLKGNNKFKLDTVIIVANKRDAPIEIKYTFKIPNYVTDTKTEVFANLNFDKNYFSDYTTKDRKYGFEFNFAFERRLVVNFLLSQNHAVKFVPDNIVFNKDDYEYNASYTTSKSNIVFKSKIAVKSKNVEVSQFDTWNDFLNAQTKNSNKSISLSKL